MSNLKPGHGKGKNALVRVEVTVADEQPSGVVPAVPVRLERRQNGTIANQATAKELGRRGGRKRAENQRMLAGLGVKIPPEGSPMRSYVLEAYETLKEHIEALAAEAGGEVGPLAGGVLATAVMQLATSRALFDQGTALNDAETLAKASKQGNDSRQNILAARELAVRAAQAREDAIRRGDWVPDDFVFGDTPKMSHDEIAAYEEKIAAKQLAAKGNDE